MLHSSREVLVVVLVNAILASKFEGESAILPSTLNAIKLASAQSYQPEQSSTHPRSDEPHSKHVGYDRTPL